MSIGAGGILRASLMLSLVLATTAVVAQPPPNGTWIDPPARGTAPTPPPPASPSPIAPVREQTAAAKSGAGKAADKTAAEDSAARRKAERPKPPVVRHARAPERERIRQAERPRPNVAAVAPRVRTAAPRFVEQRSYAAKPEPRRVVARSFATRMVTAQPYRYTPLPVGRVDDFADGERNPIFAEGEDRTRRIAAAQAAGYLVVRARSVQFPDGRMVRSYRPYEDDDGSD